MKEKDLRETIIAALGHDGSREWREVVSATVHFTKAMVRWDQALQAWKVSQNKDVSKEADEILSMLGED